MTRIVGYTSCDYEKDIDAFTVYPNPADRELHVQSTEDGMLQIFNLSGKAMSDAISINEDNQLIDISYLQPGIYQIVLQTSLKTESRKLFIK